MESNEIVITDDKHFQTEYKSSKKNKLTIK